MLWHASCRHMQAMRGSFKTRRQSNTTLWSLPAYFFVFTPSAKRDTVVHPCRQVQAMRDTFEARRQAAAAEEEAAARRAAAAATPAAPSSAERFGGGNTPSRASGGAIGGSGDDRSAAPAAAARAGFGHQHQHHSTSINSCMAMNIPSELCPSCCFFTSSSATAGRYQQCSGRSWLRPARQRRSATRPRPTSSELSLQLMCAVLWEMFFTLQHIWSDFQIVWGRVEA